MTCDCASNDRPLIKLDNSEKNLTSLFRKLFQGHLGWKHNNKQHSKKIVSFGQINHYTFSSQIGGILRTISRGLASAARITISHEPLFKTFITSFAPFFS